MLIAVPLLAALAAILSYRVLEGGFRGPWDAMAGRAVGWAAVSVLVLNLSCHGRTAVRGPVVLLDASLSMQAAGGRWQEALALARREGRPRLLGVAPGDTVPTAGESLLGPALAAGRSGGGLGVITDGALDDAAALPREVLEGVSVRVLPRQPTPDLALTRLEGSTRVAAGDSLRLRAEVSAFHGAGNRRVMVSVREGSRVWLRGPLTVPDSGTARLELAGPIPAVEPGRHVLVVAIDSAGDGEPRDDARLWVLDVAPTPGIVLLASPPTWESRFLLPALREVSGLPVRGYGRVEAGRWRRFGDLEPVPPRVVADAVRRADLLITQGDVGDLARLTRARGRWRWLASGPDPADPGDWYLATTGDGPLAGALAGLAIDSLPPASALGRVPERPQRWMALSAQAGRRGTARPAATGVDSSGVRIVEFAADGLWRWAFAGGAAEQAYRSLAASVVAWLLERGERAEGGLRVPRPVVARGRPMVFDWTGTPAATPPVLTLEGPQTRVDTLRFDGSGRAELMLEPGVWRYRSGESSGIVAVEEYSAEWLPRGRTLAPREAIRAAGTTRVSLRDQLWLFGVAVVGFAFEWVSRRRRGMR